MMARETEAILRSVLFSLERAKSLTEAKHAVMAMCSKEDIAVVREQIIALEKEEKNQS